MNAIADGCLAQGVIVLTAGTYGNVVRLLPPINIEAALLEGFNAVGVEQAAEYLPLIQHRIDRAHAELAAQRKHAEPEAEPTLFDVV